MTALALAVALMVIVACGGLISYAAIAVNDITETRERRLMDRAVERSLKRLREDVASVAVWSDAYDFTARRFDPQWAQINYGTYFHQYMHHDVSVVLDPHGRPLAAWVAGEAVAPPALADFVASARPLADAARRRSNASIAGAPQALAFDRVGAAEAAVRVGRRIYLLSASTVVPEPEYARPLLPLSDPIVLSGVEVDAEYLMGLENEYGLRRARIVQAVAADRAAVPLRGATGAPVAALAWSPERPGLGVYRNAAGWILVWGLLLITGVALILRRLRRMAQDTEEARAAAEAGDRAKADFIANMSHEIRTPLNGVLGMAQALEAYDLGPEPRACVKVIRDSGATLLGVLNDVLDLSKIEAGKLEIVDAEFRPDELAHQVCATFAELAAAKDVDLSVRCHADACGAWVGDALRIRQVLTNLVSNAVKFTAAGAVALTVEGAENGLSFSVSDTGIGVSDEQLPRLFHKFAQADTSTTRRYGGTGLGLAICREMVRLMDGEIEVASRLGEGSTFTVSLPLRRGASAQGGALPTGSDAAPARARPLRILAAEDNPTNQLVLRALLAPLEADLTLVANGREARTAFADGAFDLVLMDVQMPEMNGLDATRAIRAQDATRAGPRIPILALTANVMSHQVDSYLAAGMDGCVAKPLDAAALYAAIETALVEAQDPRTVA